MLIYCAGEDSGLGKPTGKLIPTIHLARTMAMEARMGAPDARMGSIDHYPEQ
jgi:hypothetical protein